MELLAVYHQHLRRWSTAKAPDMLHRTSAEIANLSTCRHELLTERWVVWIDNISRAKPSFMLKNNVFAMLPRKIHREVEQRSTKAQARLIGAIQKRSAELEKELGYNS